MESRTPRRPQGSVCPVCDGPLPGDGAGLEPSTCPSCGARLVPVKVRWLARRMAATGLDTALVVLSAGPLAWGLSHWLPSTPLFAGNSLLENALNVLEREPAQILWSVMPLTLMAGLYMGLFWGLSGRTPAQAVLGLRVVDAHGCRPGPLRTLVRVLTTFVGLGLGGLGWFWTAFDLERRAWHDRVAGTWVVRDV